MSKACVVICFLLTPCLLFNSTAKGQGDFFWSDRNLNEGATNDPLEILAFPGKSFFLYLYWTTHGPTMSELDTGAFLDIELTNPNVGQIISVESFDYDISVDIGGPSVGVRWGDSFGPGEVSPDGQSAMFNAFRVVEGDGIININTGPVFFDQGYDAVADAFLFARVEISIGFDTTSQLRTVAGAGGIVHDGQTVDPVFGSVAIFACPLTFFPGDANGDLLVNLLDIAAFVEAVTNGFGNCGADVNFDGVVDLNDVDPFVEALLNPPDPF